ncbi:glutamate-5-semialdehyde dehydrogenase [Rhodotorula toruloides]
MHHQPFFGISRRTAKEAFDASQLLDSSERHTALPGLERALTNAKEEILEANRQDIKAAWEQVPAGKMSSSLLKRLDLQSSADKYDSMLQGILDIDSVINARKLDEGLDLYRVTCPIGVLLVIFEARPEVNTGNAIKSGNAAILKSGKESIHTQNVMTRVIRSALSTTSLRHAYIWTVSFRSEIASLLSQNRCIDPVVPRGSTSLVRSIQHGTRIPGMGHADGLCAVFVDESAVEKKAIDVLSTRRLRIRMPATPLRRSSSTTRSSPSSASISVRSSRRQRQAPLRLIRPLCHFFPISSHPSFSNFVKPSTDEGDKAVLGTRRRASAAFSIPLITSPLLLTSPTDLKNAQRRLKEYQEETGEGRKACGGPVRRVEGQAAGSGELRMMLARLSLFQHTDDPVPPLFRLSAFVPVNLVIVADVIAPTTSLGSVIFAVGFCSV